ncbi:Nucleotide-binding alpha-beta plait [Penicillium paradoxum]|uniref:Nucleotide-binding alpha-beta plait n=1 Tax=Penicillium paradoxum TaxID=176176 RepID=UPI0025498585|nr:Nucleotide-binding alpha-beta plait [Penicillium paradoxum]KAJ5783203.1 Nucleotide-binding alpha-beta plait [Penicillium paradoxum]
MHPQGSQHTSSSGSGQTSSTQSGQYHQNEPRTPYGHRYHQSTNVNSRDNSVGGLTNLFRGLNLHNSRPKSKTNSAVQINTNMDWSNANRAYNSPFILVPNSTVFNGVPAVSSFVPNAVHGQADQMGQFSYLPTGVYSNVNPVVPGGYPSWPYMMNYDMHDNKQGPWSLSEAQKGAQGENTGQVQYYPSNLIPGMDGSAMSSYSYGGMVPSQLGSLSLPLQMMKTQNGYVVQDLEALTQQEPAIPRAVPAMWTNPSELTLAKCLENREGITNVYIRGFLPETTDDMLHSYAARFGKIERCKAIVDLDTSLCKGFGFVQYYSFESCENCIRGFFYLGYQASFAQKSRNSRLKDLEDRSSTNIYCTNIPIDWTEADLRRHFEPWRVVSEKISRDEKTGVSKEVGFARFENREVAEKVLMEFHNITKEDGVKLLLRFADTKAQKILKQQSNERRAYRAGEYNYSVEVVQGSTPSPGVKRGSHLTPNSQVSYTSPAGVGSNWTPATSISPCHPHMKNPSSSARSSSLSSRSLNALDNTPSYRTRAFSLSRRSYTDLSGGSSKTIMPDSPIMEPRKENIRAGSASPGSSPMMLPSSARSCT